ncbi:hypothetical protein SAMN06295943_0734 [Agreia sp. VKM Ac-1783]|jgi:hypothetical protein|nr:hypothetical protein SAMN06295943_0734 [Agreia sp. VKM Ac-1783]
MQWPRASAFIAAAALVTVLSLALGGCAIAPPHANSRTPETPTMTETTMKRGGTGELRTDLEPLTSRFDLLTGAESATWLSGTLGDDSVPGPSIYWIDAIVTLPEADAQKIVGEYEVTQTTTTPTVESPLDEKVPEGPYLASPALDAAFSQDTFRSTVHLAADGRTLIVRSVFQ